MRVQDHSGNWYKSEKEMCASYGIKINTYKNRKRLGWGLRECLLGRDKSCKDNYGTKYGSVKEMCDVYGVTIS